MIHMINVNSQNCITISSIHTDARRFSNIIINARPQKKKDVIVQMSTLLTIQITIHITVINSRRYTTTHYDLLSLSPIKVMVCIFLIVHKSDGGVQVQNI